MSIPTNYQNLSGFRTSYSESELRLAIAITEAFIANNLGGGGGSGGASQTQVQAAIEAASNLDGVEPTLSSLDGKTPALGQALASASVPVVLPAAQIATLTPPTAIRLLDTGGSTQATVKAGSTGFAITDTALVTTSRDLPLELSGSGSSVGVVIASTNVSGYQSASLQLSGTFAANVSIEGSNDNITWYNLTWQNFTTSTPSVNQGIATGVGIYDVRLNCKFIRVRIGNYTSGTVNATLIINKFPNSFVGVSNGSFSISGITATSLSSVTVRNQQYTTGTISSSGDTIVIVAPGTSISIHITSLIIQLEGTTATTVLIKDGISTKKRILLQNQGDAFFKDWTAGQEFKLAASTAFILNLSGANTIGYSIEYYLA